MWRPSLVVEAVSRMSPRRWATWTFRCSILPYSWRVSVGGIEDENAGITIEKDVVAAREAAAQVMDADDGGNIHRASHDGGMRGLASLFGGKTKDERAVDRCGIGRGEIPGDNNVWLVFGRDHAGRLSEQVPNHAARDVLDIDHPLAKIGIIDGAESAAILLRDLMEGVFDIVSLLFKISEDFIDQRAVFDHQKMRIKNPRILGADGVGDSLLDLEQLGASGDQGRFETGDFLG